MGLVAAALGAQEAPKPASEPLQGATDDASVQRLLDLHLTEREQVRLVLLPTAVTDRKGRVVRGLSRKDFQLLEDQVPQEIKYFTTERTESVSLAFLLDLSGSMRQVGKLDEAKEAIRYFVDTLRPEDQFALIGFADDQVSWITDFTSDRQRFLARLDVQRAYGQTALYDAVAATPTLVDQRTAGRKAIVLITDGIDNASSLDLFGARQVARRVEVPIYAIGFSNIARKLLRKGRRPAGLQTLDLLAEETGGLLFPVHDPADVKEAVKRNDDELRFGYVIGFYPVRRSWDGEFRRISLRVGKNRLSVRTRRGYYANP